MSFEAGTQADDVGLRILESICPYVPDAGETRLKFKRQTWRQLIEASLSRAGLERYVSDTTRLIEARRDILADVIAPLVEKVLEARNYARFRGSHDQNNDALQVYRNVYGLPFEPCNPGETGGLEWADHYMTVDAKTPHPFFKDELLEDGKYKLGCPGLFIIVKDEKYPYPQSATPDALHDSDLCRYQFSNWRMRPSKLSEAGLVEYGPMKMNDDFGQMLQMILLGNQISAAPLTYGETIELAIPPSHRYEELKKRNPNEEGLTVPDEISYMIARTEAKKKIRPQFQRFDEWDAAVED
jgi:hypothetical protein